MSCADIIRRQEWALAKAICELSKDHSLDELTRVTDYSKSMLERFVLAAKDLEVAQRVAGVFIGEDVDLSKIASLHKVIAAGSLNNFGRFVLRKRQLRLNIYLLTTNANQIQNDVAEFLKD